MLHLYAHLGAHFSGFYCREINGLLGVSHSEEALYLPLAQRERALGKAVIDIMVYRVAKAGAAIFLLALSWLGDLSASTVIGGLAVAAVSAWLFFALRVLPIYGQKTNEQRDAAVGEA